MQPEEVDGKLAITQNKENSEYHGTNPIYQQSSQPQNAITG